METKRAVSILTVNSSTSIYKYLDKTSRAGLKTGHNPEDEFFPPLFVAEH